MTSYNYGSISYKNNGGMPESVQYHLTNSALSYSYESDDWAKCFELACKDAVHACKLCSFQKELSSRLKEKLLHYVLDYFINFN